MHKHFFYVLGKCERVKHLNNGYFFPLLEIFSILCDLDILVSNMDSILKKNNLITVYKSMENF